MLRCGHPMVGFVRECQVRPVQVSPNRRRLSQPQLVIPQSQSVIPQSQSVMPQSQSVMPHCQFGHKPGLSLRSPVFFSC